MPGLTGILGSPRPASDLAAEIGLMRQALQVEPLYRSGQWSGAPFPVQIAWAVLPESSERQLLLVHERGDLALFFHGEVYGSGGQVLEDWLRLYEEIGVPALAELNGRFCGLLVNQRLGQCVLFNDRFGLERVYLHEARDGLRFASSARALLAGRSDLRAFEARGLAEFFSVGCALQDRTLFRGINLLPPGSAWVIDRDGRIQRGTYFQPREWEQQTPLSAREYPGALIETFRAVVPDYLRGEAAKALSLTGGLDSRLFLAWAGAAAGTLPCYSFAGPIRECADVRIARELARVAGQAHQAITLGEDFFADFPRLAAQCMVHGDGAMDVSGAVELHVNRRARAIAPVRLTGNYGSEILRSNVAFRPARSVPELLVPDFAASVRRAAETWETEFKTSRHSFISFKQVPWHHYGRYAIERSQLTLRSPFLDNRLVGLAYRVPPELATSADPLLALIHAGNPALSSVRTDRSLTAGRATLGGRMARAWQEFTVRAEYACDYGMPPALARLDRWLKLTQWQNLFLGRHKFYHFRTWYRDALAPYLKSVLLDGRTLARPWWDGRKVERLVEEHTRGAANHTSDLHKVLTCELTQRELLDQP